MKGIQLTAPTDYLLLLAPSHCPSQRVSFRRSDSSKLSLSTRLCGSKDIFFLSERLAIGLLKDPVERTASAKTTWSPCYSPQTKLPGLIVRLLQESVTMMPEFLSVYGGLPIVVTSSFSEAFPSYDLEHSNFIYQISQGTLLEPIRVWVLSPWKEPFFFALLRSHSHPKSKYLMLSDGGSRYNIYQQIHKRALCDI